MHKCNKKSFVEKITSTSFSCLQLKHKTSFLHQSPFRWSLIPWRLFRPIKSTFEQNCPSTQIGILYQHQEHKNMRQTVNDAFLFAKLHFIHVFLIFHLFGNIPSQSVELNLWSGVHQILTAMLRKSDVTWWPHLQEKRLGKLVQRILTKPLIGHWVTRWTTGKAGSLQGKRRQPAAVLMWMYEKGGFWKRLRHGLIC